MHFNSDLLLLVVLVLGIVCVSELFEFLTKFFGLPRDQLSSRGWRGRWRERLEARCQRWQERFERRRERMRQRWGGAAAIGPSADDRELEQRLTGLLDRMEQRIGNLETILADRARTGSAGGAEGRGA